jgi:predicted dienelactone hydrolase
MFPLRRRLTGICLGAITGLLWAFPLLAAEKLFFSYGPLMLSLRVESLSAFAQTGAVDPDLAFYLNRVSPEQQQAFRAALTRPLAIDPVWASRFFNSAMGQEILVGLGKGITIPGGSNGAYALRAAIVQGAFEPGGLTVLKVLENLPTDMQVQGEVAAGFAQKLQDLVLATETLVQELRRLTAQEAALAPQVNYEQLPDLRQSGPYGVKKTVWKLVDRSRNRAFYVDVFQPQNPPEGELPVIVFSHGLTSRPEDYAVNLEHLAAYGYVVAAPQHPGSDKIYLEEMLAGYHRNIFDEQEFINRPLDLKFVLDEVERRNPGEFQGRLNLPQVGVAGHSFGGYTALAVAGAEIDFENLERDCQRPYSGIDISLLLECRALALPRQRYSFRDPRIQAVFAANPVNRSIFGPKGLEPIQVPVLLASGSDDPAAPPALEQITSFLWLTPPDKYWMLLEGQAHVNFTELDASLTHTLNATLHLVLPSQNLIYDYVKGASIAFFETYIRADPQSPDRYRAYLNPAYAEYLSAGQTFKLDMVTAKSAPALRQLVDNFRAEHGGLLSE